MSSVAAAISNFRRHLGGLNDHIRTAFQPEIYLIGLKGVAQAVLESLSFEAAHIESILSSMEAFESVRGFQVSMSFSPPGGNITPEEWVAEFKRLDPKRDFYHKDDPHGNWVAGQVKAPDTILDQIDAAARKEGNVPDAMPWALPASFTRTDLEMQGANNPEGLLAKTRPPEAVPDEKTQEAMRKILEAWCDPGGLRASLVEAVRQRIRNSFED